VSPRGDDTNDGSVDKPFRTVRRAQVAARDASRGNVTVHLAQGRHVLDAPLVFGPEDGRGEGRAVTYRAGGCKRLPHGRESSGQLDWGEGCCALHGGVADVVVEGNDSARVPKAINLNNWAEGRDRSCMIRNNKCDCPDTDALSEVEH